MPGSKVQKAVHACMTRLLNLGPAKHEEGVICVANQRIPNVCRIAGAACCGAIRNEIFRWHQLGAKDLLTTNAIPYYNIRGKESYFAPDYFLLQSIVYIQIIDILFKTDGVKTIQIFLPCLIIIDIALTHDKFCIRSSDVIL